MSIYRIRFSSIKNKLLRRALMIVASPFILVCNWLFVVIALLFAAPGLFLRATLTNFDGFIRVWNGERVEDENGPA